ncbi:MAG: opioid growth factor receptor-related protein [Rhodospirillaceae bacterium]|nr:opioid growth factor receptor-related protein [Rhodospirillaceae bacterium]
MTDSAVIAFMRGAGTDPAGRRIADIWTWDHRRLEMVHDYIQWLFPLPEPSRFNPDAPLLSAADIAALRADADLRARVLRSLDLMLAFLGLVRTPAGVARGADFAARSANWLEVANHNHLRLTRILLFLGHAGLAAEAAALFACLADIAAHEGRGRIADRTLAFWRDALTSPRTSNH